MCLLLTDIMMSERKKNLFFPCVINIFFCNFVGEYQRTALYEEDLYTYNGVYDDIPRC